MDGWGHVMSERFSVDQEKSAREVWEFSSSKKMFGKVFESIWVRVNGRRRTCIWFRTSFVYMFFPRSGEARAWTTRVHCTLKKCLSRDWQQLWLVHMFKPGRCTRGETELLFPITWNLFWPWCQCIRVAWHIFAHVAGFHQTEWIELLRNGSSSNGQTEKLSVEFALYNYFHHSW
jgi:hypothetical protein